MHQYASPGSHEPSGAVRPFRAILPTAKRRAPSAHEAADGYAAPKAPAGQSCLDGEYFNAWPRQYGYASIVFL